MIDNSDVYYPKMDETLWCWEPEEIAAVLTSAAAAQKIRMSAKTYISHLHWSRRDSATRILWMFDVIIARDYEDGTFGSYDWLQ